jgi:hypothetical protein
VFSSCCNGGGAGGGVGVMVTLDYGGGDGQTSDPIMGDPRSASLALDLSDRIPVGLHLGPTQILTIHLGAGLGGESSTRMTSTGSMTSSSLAAATPPSPSSPPSLELGDDNTIRLGAIG